MSAPTPPAPPVDPPGLVGFRNDRQHGRPSALDGSNEPESAHGTSRHQHTLRSKTLVDSESEDSSDTSISARDSRRRRSKPLRSKPTRSLKPRAFSSFESALATNSESVLPTLGRILEGKSSAKDGAPRPNTSSIRSRSKTTSYHKHGHSQTSRRARSNLSQSELQSRARALASPSLQSVLSSLTAATSSSSGSNGSNSTVTQSSFSKLEATEEGSPAHQKSQDATNSHRRRRRHHKERKSEVQPNVFAFMEEEEEEEEGEQDADKRNPAWKSDGILSDQAPPPPPPPPQPQSPAIKAHRSSADPFVSPRPMRVASFQTQDQLHSDSGISVRGSSPESVGRRNSLKQEDDTKTKTDDAAANAQDHIEATSSWQRRWSSTSAGMSRPAPYLLRQGSAQPQMPLIPYAHAPPGSYSTHATHPNLDTQPGSTEEVAVSGHDKLAAHLLNEERGHSDKVVPLYRRFSRVNHRIFLHLQDEIAEMEEQLQQLDSYVAHYKASSGHPESRRADARYHDDLTFRRTELLGWIFVKVRQYNDALSSYRQVCQQAQPARSEDIERYRQLIKKLDPVADEELRFLDHRDDLLSFRAAEQPPTEARPTPTRPITVMPALLLGPPAAMLVAFVLFSAAASGLVRVFLFVLLSCAGFAAVRIGGLGKEVMTDHERDVCLGFYASLLACIAATAG